MKTQIYNLPTYEEALAIVKKCGELVFYEMVMYAEGYKISTFNYRLAKYNDFVENKAEELRGLCFVFNSDGTVYRRFLLMDKFYNLNQVEKTQLDIIKDIEIVSVENKADGSIINFIELPNGKILAKSKMSVDNDQSKLAMEVYEKNESIQKLVKYCLANNIVAVFELVSPLNRVVLKYEKTDLILTKLRNELTGEYIDKNTLGDLLNGVTIIETLPYKSWDEIISLSETVKGIEGWVVELKNGMFVKQKTVEYWELHFITTESIHREDFLISMIVDEKIDEIISQLGEQNEEVKAIIDSIINKVQVYFKKTNDEVTELVNKYHTVYNKSRKDFAISEKKNKNFAYVCSVLDGKDQFTVIAEDLKKKTYHLESARSFLQTGEIF